MQTNLVTHGKKLLTNGGERILDELNQLVAVLKVALELQLLGPLSFEPGFQEQAMAHQAGMQISCCVPENGTLGNEGDEQKIDFLLVVAVSVDAGSDAVECLNDQGDGTEDHPDHLKPTHLARPCRRGVCFPSA